MKDTFASIASPTSAEDSSTMIQQRRDADRQSEDARARFRQLLLLAPRNESTARAPRANADRRQERGGPSRAKGPHYAEVIGRDTEGPMDADVEEFFAEDIHSAGQPRPSRIQARHAPARDGVSSLPDDMSADPPLFAGSSSTRDEQRQADDLLARLAGRLVTLCKHKPALQDNWAITLKMDPDVLPETELRIQASRCWMRLRFSTHSAQSMRLISQHLAPLGRMLETALDMNDQIDVDFE